MQRTVIDEDEREQNEKVFMYNLVPWFGDYLLITQANEGYIMIEPPYKNTYLFKISALE